MTEHIKMMPQEAKQKAEATRKIILDTYHNEANAGHRRPCAHAADSRQSPGGSPEEMIECEVIPEVRGLVDFFVRSWIDIPLAECYAVHMEEEIFGFISQDFRQSLRSMGSRPKT